jgi:predicted amidohydrolase
MLEWFVAPQKRVKFNMIDDLQRDKLCASYSALLNGHAGDATQSTINQYVLAIEAVKRGVACCALPSTPSYFYGRGATLYDRVESSDCFSIAPPGQACRQKNDFVLPAVRIVNPGEEAFVANIHVKDGIIVSIYDPNSALKSDAQVMHEYAGHVVMPGLIDMHVHMPAKNILNLTPHFLRMFIAHGVTGFREAGDVDGSALLEIRRLQKDERVIAPRIAASYFFVGRPPFRWKNSIAYSSPDDAPSIIQKLKRVGASCIKLYENLTPEDIAVLKEHAEEAGLVVMGHVPSKLSIEEAMIPDAQHFFGVPAPASLRRDHVFSRAADWQKVAEARIREVVMACKTHAISNTPTLVTTDGLMKYKNYKEACEDMRGLMPSYYPNIIWHPTQGLPAYRGLTNVDFYSLEDAFQKKKQLVSELFKNECNLFLGTDTQQPFSIPGLSFHRELELFVECGLTPAQALQRATSAAAKRLGWHNTGEIRVGKNADLLVMKDDPTRSLSALKTLEQVIVEGQIQNVSDVRRQISSDLEHRERFLSRHGAAILAKLAMNRLAKNFIG